MKRMNKYVVIVAGVILLLFVLLGIRAFRQALENKYTFTTNSQTVIKELRSLSRLETASFTIEKVIDAGTNGNQFQQILFGDRILLIAHGDVVAGFDLSTLTQKDISVEGQT